MINLVVSGGYLAEIDTLEESEAVGEKHENIVRFEKIRNLIQEIWTETRNYF